jgi:class 3 adenylate cyclase/CHASE2 domain-containing sensor protein
VNRRLRDAAILLAIAVAATLLALGLRAVPFLATLETWTMDYRVATLLPPEPQHPEIVVVAINEQTLERFPYRSPVDRRFLAGLLRTLDRAGARAIFLDVLFDQPTEADKDAELKQVMETLRAPLVVSYGRQAEGLSDSQVEFLDGFVRPDALAFANLVRDPFDGVARWVYPGRALPDGRFVAGVAPALLQRLGRPVPALPGDGEGRIEIAWRGAPDAATPPFKRFPAHAVPVLPPAWFKDKIVMVGFDLTDRDRHVTPFRAAHVSELAGGSTLPGVVIHAHILAQLLEGRPAPDHGLPGAVLVIGLAALLGVGLGRLDIPLWGRVGLAVVLIGGIWVGGFVLFNSGGIMLPLVWPSVGLGLAVWMTDIQGGREERQQRRFIQGAFSKYISPALLEELVQDPSKLSLDPRRRQLSLLFTDVAGFTSLSEGMDPAHLADLMNRYLDGMVKLVFAHGGTVDKFIGDAVFAIFNAPRDQPDHPRAAVACGLAMDAYAQQFLADELAAGRGFGVTRIGIHTDEASIGNFGAQERFEYTALGDAVNTASRLEGLNKHFGTRVMMSGSTAALVPGQPARPVGRVILKGKAQPLPVFEPLTAEAAASPFMQAYEQAYALLDGPDLEAARQAFAALAAERPDDGPVALFCERLAAGDATTLVRMTDK